MENADGSGTLTHDSKWGNVVNTVAVAGITAVVDLLANVDWSSWPTWVGTIGAPAAALVAGLLTSKYLPRFKR